MKIPNRMVPYPEPTPYDIPPMVRDFAGRWISVTEEQWEELNRLRNQWIRNKKAERTQECWNNCNCNKTKEKKTK